MKNTFNFTLLNPAKNKGGDKYETKVNGKDWIVYFPQKISRPAGRPAHDISITVNVGGINPEELQHDKGN